MPGETTVRIVGVPFDFGSDRRGVDMGPSALRYTGLAQRIAALGYRVEDRGNVPVPVPETCPDPGNGPLYLPQVQTASRRVAEAMLQTLEQHHFPLMLGGDHALSLGTALGLGRWGGEVGILWFDAHADFNTAATSPTGNLHGMCLAALVGQGDPDVADLWGDVPFIPPERVAVIGLRSVDPGERERLKGSGLHLYSMLEIDRHGIFHVLDDALAAVGEDLEHLYVSLDLDVVDPSHAPGVGTPVPGGLSYREAHLAMERLARTGRVMGAEVVELNPILDQSNRTARLAAQLVLSLLGQRIL